MYIVTFNTFWGLFLFVFACNFPFILCAKVFLKCSHCLKHVGTANLIVTTLWCGNSVGTFMCCRWIIHLVPN
ncbi:hypothetical protein GDO81_009243 [Engystomops pustulosus]|uniref:Uncharacterized protein n=1 Tax=Engystomops pustulosus TaxID=76066 RepID=A0AAV7BPK7_ENGPU|nr:hypothetical protein GDO81_009243 [Engystomops pustulosus]